MPPRRARVLSIGLAALILALDQISKLILDRAFEPGQSVPILPGIFHFTYVRNAGAAFGVLQGQRWIFLAFAACVIVWMAGVLRSASRQGRFDWTAALVLGGAAGNLIDRIRFGYVLDFLDFRVWPVFNIADSALTIGVAAIVWQAWRTRGEG